MTFSQTSTDPAVLLTMMPFRSDFDKPHETTMVQRYQMHLPSYSRKRKKHHYSNL
jgi:hypothetical protein